MVLTYEIGISSATVWNILDHFLIDLANLGDDICKSPVLTKPLYMDLVKLVCEGKKDALKLIAHGKPYYPFILTSYYTLFHRRNLAIAEAICNELVTVHEKYPYSFDNDEESALEMLKRIIEYFVSLGKQSVEECKGHLHHNLQIIASEIEKIVCPERGWSKLFKKMLLSHLIPEESMNYLENISKEISSFRGFVIEEEIAEAFNLIESNETPTIYIFLEKVSSNIKKNIIENFSKLSELIKRKEELKVKINKSTLCKNKFFQDFVKSLRNILTTITILLAIPFIGIFVIGVNAINITNIISIFVGLPIDVVISAIFYNCYRLQRNLDKINEEIDNFVESCMLRDIYEIIWPSSKLIQK
jgi:hypothetical protein